MSAELICATRSDGPRLPEPSSSIWSRSASVSAATAFACSARLGGLRMGGGCLALRRLGCGGARARSSISRATDTAIRRPSRSTREVLSGSKRSGEAVRARARARRRSAAASSKVAPLPTASSCSTRRLRASAGVLAAGTRLFSPTRSAGPTSHIECQPRISRPHETGAPGGGLSTDASSSVSE